MLAASGWANTSNCPTGFTSFNSGAIGVNIPQSSTSTLSPVELSTINSNSTGFSSGVTAGGCFGVEQSFSNLAVNGSNQSGTTDYASVGNGTAGQSITFSSMAGDSTSSSADNSNNFTTSNSTGVGNHGTLNFVDYSDFGTTATPSSIPGLVEVTVTIAGVSLASGAGNSIVVSEVGCSGVSGTGHTGTFTGCTTGANQPGGSAIPGNFSNTFTSSNVSLGQITFSVFTLPSNLTSIATDFSVTLNGGSTAFATFTEAFDAPEPSSFVLLGSALAGLGFLRFRKRHA